MTIADVGPPKVCGNLRAGVLGGLVPPGRARVKITTTAPSEDPQEWRTTITITPGHFRGRDDEAISVEVHAGELFWHLERAHAEADPRARAEVLAFWRQQLAEEERGVTQT